MPNFLIIDTIKYVWCEDCHNWEIWATRIHRLTSDRTNRFLNEYENSKVDGPAMYSYIKHLFTEEEKNKEPGCESSIRTQVEPTVSKGKEEQIYDEMMVNQEVLIHQARSILSLNFPDYTESQIDALIGVLLMIKRGE